MHRPNLPKRLISDVPIPPVTGGHPIPLQGRVPVVLPSKVSNKASSRSLLRVTRLPICRLNRRLLGRRTVETQGQWLLLRDPIRESNNNSNHRARRFRIWQRLLALLPLDVERKRLIRPRRRISSSVCNRFVQMRILQSYTGISPRSGKGGLNFLSFFFCMERFIHRNLFLTVPLVVYIPRIKLAPTCALLSSRWI